MKNVQLPVSKSLYIRKLIYDFLYNDRIGAIPSDSPEDVRVVHHCLTCISQDAEGGAEQREPQRIDVRDCGAAYRFLMAVLAVTPGQWLLTGNPRLMQRPIEELVQSLRSVGAEIQWCSCRDVPWRVSTNAKYNSCWQIHGKPLHASELTIDCTRSGQFASALLLISDKIGLKNLNILPENPSSSAYIAMTKSIMAGEADLNPMSMGDWSAAVYWYARLLLSQCHWHSKRNNDAVSEAAPAFNADVFPCSYKLMNLDLDSLQADAVIARWFAQWGVVSRQEKDGVVIKFKEILDCQKNTLDFGNENASQNEEVELDKSADFQGNVIELDMSQNLDLVPVLACMACLWPKKMVFNGVANLKYKESDRLKIIQEQLSSFAKIDIKSHSGIPDNQLVINPICCRDVPWRVSTNDHCSNIPPRIFSFDAHNDHRFVMGFSLFALKGKVQIKGFDCVRKSYPDFKAEGVVAWTDMVG
ncbi:MAG: hypothetical protein J5644_04020 [Bacteroidales bacterium]|nr:hypothetical protein [Bacteroidales bacterium]